jgi:hypothetical protein
MKPAALPLVNGSVSQVYSINLAQGQCWLLNSPTGDFIGTLRIEGSLDGVTWLPLAIDLNGNQDITPGMSAESILAFILSAKTITYMRWRVTAFTSGVSLAVRFTGLVPASQRE